MIQAEWRGYQTQVLDRGPPLSQEQLGLLRQAFFYGAAAMCGNFLEPFDLTAYRVAEECHIPRTRIERIMREETGITADTALRLAKFFGTTPEFWLNLQARFEMEIARAEIAYDLETIKQRDRVAA